MCYEVVWNKVALVGGRLPNVCVSHAANSPLTGLLSSHLKSSLHYISSTPLISLTAILYFSEFLPTHPNAWFIVCLSVTLSQFVENTYSVQKKETNTHFASSSWSVSMWMLNSRLRNVTQIQSPWQRTVNNGGWK